MEIVLPAEERNGSGSRPLRPGWRDVCCEGPSSLLADRTKSRSSSFSDASSSCGSLGFRGSSPKKVTASLHQMQLARDAEGNLWR